MDIILYIIYSINGYIFIIIILTNGHYTQSVDWCISRVSHNLKPSAPLMAGDTAPFFGTVARKCAPHPEVTPLGG